MATHKSPKEPTLNRRPTPAVVTVGRLQLEFDPTIKSLLLAFNLPCQELHRLITHIPKR
jgi:hypothetical protein